MPNYYSGADSTQAFSSGLMAGYEFIDRIKARAEQARIQKLQEERAAEAFEMQKEGFATQQKVAGLQIEDYTADIADESKERKYRDTQRPIQEAKANVEFQQGTQLKGLQISAIQQQIEDAKRAREGRDAYGNLIESVGSQGQSTLGDIARQGTQPGVGEGTVLKPGVQGTPQSPTAPPPQAAAAPPDLRVAQREQDAQPNIIQRTVAAVKESFAEGQRQANTRDTKNAWSEIANPTVSGNGRISTERLTSVPIREIRLNPERYVDAYTADRDKVDPKDRPALDTTMRAATLEARDRAIAEMKQLDPADPKNKPKFAALTTQQAAAAKSYEALNKAVAKDAGAAVLPKGGTTSADNPNVLPAITGAKQAQDAAGVLPKVTEQTLRLQQTQLGRMDNPARLNKQQLNWLSEAFRTGAIDPQTYSNWIRYGGPIAPQPPKVIPFGAGKGVVLYSNGQLAEIDFGGSGKGGKGGNDGGVSFNQKIGFLTNYVNDSITRGDLNAPKGTGLHELGKIMQLLQRHGQQFQQQNPEVDIFDERGEISMDWADNPLHAIKVLDWGVGVLSGKVDEPDEAVDPIPDGEEAARTIPTTPWVR